MGPSAALYQTAARDPVGPWKGGRKAAPHVEPARHSRDQQEPAGRCRLVVAAGLAGDDRRRYCRRMTAMVIVLLIAADLVGLAMIPLGLPGLWVMVGAFLIYGAVTDFVTVGVWSISIVVVLALIGEIVESWLGFRFARRYGGSSRSGWGALLGGLVGAGMGIPVPVIGSVIGAFLGAFIGAALFEYSLTRHTGVAVGAGWGAVLGRAAAAATKIAIGLVIAVTGIFAVLA